MRHISCTVAVVIAFALLVVTGTSDAAEPCTGHVVDEDGRPLAGAKVTALEIMQDNDDWEKIHKRELASVVTGTDGRFRFEANTMEKCAVVVAAKLGKCLDSSPPRLAGPGEIMLRLGPAAQVEGLIVDQSGKPVSSAKVKAVFPELPGKLWELITSTTDPQGRFRITDLPADAAVDLDMSAAGYTSALAEGPFAPGQKGLRFVLPPEGRLEGMLVAKDTGKPLANVRLSAISGVASGMRHGYAKTDHTGRFTMRGLSGGSYKIQTEGEIVNGDLLPPEWLGSTEKVRVEAGKLTAGVKMDAVQGGLLEIVLTDDVTGRTVKSNGTLIVANEKDLRISHWVSPSKDGAVRLRLTPGTYVVTEAISTAYSLKQPRSAAFRVETGKTNRVAVAVRVHETRAAGPGGKSGARAIGTACDPQGKPVPKARVKVLSLTGDVAGITAGNEGAFSIPAANIGPLACFVWVRHPEKDLVALGMATLRETDPPEETRADDTFAVLGAKARQITLRPPLTLLGVVCDPAGRPIAGANVTAQVDASHMGRSGVFLATRTDQAGRYRLGLAALTIPSYAIVAKALGYGDAEVVVHPADLVPDSKKAAKIVLYPANRTVRGVVQDPEGRPVAGAVITAKRIASQKYPGCVVSDAEGRFVLEHLDDADVIYLFARVPGHGWRDLGATIRPGEKETVVRVGPCDWD